MKFKLPSWKKGEEFIQEMASRLEAQIETRDAKQIIEVIEGKITFHPDDRGFAFLTCKIMSEELKQLIIEIKDRYQ
ncbi:hypothetical protein KAR91_73345 [Candidatus Pacearchaeota archaeon]|nr:hypothetical protein [Candidatus Pacearchaeota archaeon]